MKPGSLLSVFLLFGAAFAEQPPIAIVYEFEQEPTAGSYSALVEETQTLLDPAGIRVVWRKQGSQSGSESFSQVVFVRYKGACRTSLGTAPDADFETVRLGAARVESGRVLPVAEVDCTEIRRFLDAAPARQRALTLGRALARVTAHELYHVLLRTTAHGRDGLSKATVGTAELGSRHFAFHQDEIQRFNRR